MIPKLEWIRYYKHFWTEKDINDGYDRENLLYTETEDENIVNITMIELEEVLKKAKNRRSPGLDNLSMELFKYGRNELKRRILDLFNTVLYIVKRKYHKTGKQV